MAKSPAVLFYTSDFLVGTSLMSNEAKGAYITVLCYQHQIGHISEEHMKNICGSYVPDKNFLSKFSIDEDGCYYNHRMEEEIQKRSKYSESRANNRRKTAKEPKAEKHMKNICNSYEKHMENENENENINKDVINSLLVNKPLWKTSFEAYKKEELEAYQKLVADQEWLINREKYHPNLNILLSLEKAHCDYWSTEAGWKHKKQKRSNSICWKTTYQNALTMKSNQVWKNRSGGVEMWKPGDPLGQPRPLNEYDINDN